MELSINFIVILFLSLTVFFFGSKFIYDLSSQAVTLEGMSSDQLDDKIQDLLCDSNDRVCIGEDRMKIKRGDLGVFGIKITNVLPQEKFFEVNVSRPSRGGYDRENNPIHDDNLKWMPQSRGFSLDRNAERSIAIGVEVPKDAVIGTYVFDVKIQPYDELYKLYAIVS